MRYILRRTKPEDFADIRSRVPDLDTKLGTPAENLRNGFTVNVEPSRYAQFVFHTKKTAKGWTWTCPCIELVAEDEKGLFALTKLFNEPPPAHLTHLLS